MAQVDEAMSTSLESVAEIFKKHNVKLEGLVINIVFEEGDVTWALGSNVPELEEELRDFLTRSLRTSAEELDDA
jgi:hypothetical protein